MHCCGDFFLLPKGCRCRNSSKRKTSTTSLNRAVGKGDMIKAHGHSCAHDGDAFPGDRQRAVFLLLRGHDLPGGGFVAG